MTLKYFKPDILIDTRCEHCGAARKETLARLYSDEALLCATCGREHTADRTALRHNVDEMESLIDKVPNLPRLS
jgi:hypothetical protein